MTARGFTLVELLMATVVTMLLLGAGLGMAASARWSLSVEPAALDVSRRARDAAFALSDAIRAGGGAAAVGDGVVALGAALPVVRPLTSLDGTQDGRFRAVSVLSALPGAAARLAEPQAGPAGALTLDTRPPCALTTPVCGFRVGDVAAVFDQRGRYDVFEVGFVSDTLVRITPRAPLARAYDERAWVVPVRFDRFGLIRQPDGSQTLTRLTWAGAREPMVDGVVDLEIEAWGAAAAPNLGDADEGPGIASYGLPPPRADDVDASGMFAAGEHCMVFRDAGLPHSWLAPRPEQEAGLTRLRPVDFSDGPWCPDGSAPDAFDADLLRLRRLDIRLRVEAASAELRGPAGPLFARGGTAGGQATRWVVDRRLQITVSFAGR